MWVGVALGPVNDLLEGGHREAADKNLIRLLRLGGFDATWVERREKRRREDEEDRRGEGRCGRRRGRQEPNTLLDRRLVLVLVHGGSPSCVRTLMTPVITAQAQTRLLHLLCLSVHICMDVFVHVLV